MTRIRSATWSSASARVKAMTAPLEAQYAARLRRPTKPAIEAMLSITPPSALAIRGIACLQHR